MAVDESTGGQAARDGRQIAEGVRKSQQGIRTAKKGAHAATEAAHLFWALPVGMRIGIIIAFAVILLVVVVSSAFPAAITNETVHLNDAETLSGAVSEPQSSIYDFTYYGDSEEDINGINEMRQKYENTIRQGIKNAKNDAENRAMRIVDRMSVDGVRIVSYVNFNPPESDLLYLISAYSISVDNMLSSFAEVYFTETGGVSDMDRKINDAINKPNQYCQTGNVIVGADIEIENVTDGEEVLKIAVIKLYDANLAAIVKDGFMLDVSQPLSIGSGNLEDQNSAITTTSIDPFIVSGASAAALNNLLIGTPIANTGKCWENLETKYGVNALFALAVCKQESGMGTSRLAKTKNNLFGMYDSTNKCWTAYDSKESSINAFGSLISGSSYYNEKTVDEIAVHYCASGPQDWAKAVQSIMRSYLRTLQANGHQVTDFSEGTCSTGIYTGNYGYYAVGDRVMEMAQFAAQMLGMDLQTSATLAFPTDTGGRIVASLGPVKTNAEIQRALNELPASVSALRKEACRYAYSLVGRVKYFWGGKHLAYGENPNWGKSYTVWAAGSTMQPKGSSHPYGLDCSGFVQWVCYQVSGVDIANGGGAQMEYNLSTKITASEALPGDLIFTYTPGKGTVHVGMIVGANTDGTLKVIDCNLNKSVCGVRECTDKNFTYGVSYAVYGRPKCFE